jgi:glycolate oxidase
MRQQGSEQTTASTGGAVATRARRGGGSALGARLAAVVGAEHVRTDPGALRVYGRDATPLFSGAPDAVVFPGTTGEVAGVLRLAGELGVPVTPRGAGSNLSAGTVAHRGGIVLALTRMDRLLELDLDDLVVVCQPGLATARVGAAAAEHGLLYPPDPGSRTTSTIGGNVAENAGGLRGLKYGVTRDYVLGCEAVLPTGEVIRAGGKAVKDVAGYDLVRLLCGSEGTLAVLTELTLRLVPAPEATGLGLAYFPALTAAGRAVSRTLRAGVLPATLEFLDATCIEAVEDFAGIGLRRAGAALIFGQDGGPETVRRDVERIAEACAAEGALDVVVARDDREAERILQARRAALPALSRLGRITMLEDATVPRSRIAAMVERIEAAGERHGLRIGTFGHAGDGNLHPTVVLPDDDAASVERAHAAFAEIFAAAIELGGTITGEHGVGLAKLAFLEQRLGADHVALLRRIKRAFDPQGLLNPGKLGS